MCSVGAYCLFVNFQSGFPRESIVQIRTPYIAAAFAQVTAKEQISGLAVVIHDAEDLRHAVICSQLIGGVVFFADGIQRDGISLNLKIGNSEREGNHLLRRQFLIAVQAQIHLRRP